jgi:diguanylate cyclase (GGDEF)-like protein
MWSLAATLIGLHSVGAGQFGSAYFATAALILVASLIENSYFLAYHDELTSLPSRRAFNDALLGLQPPYVIAAADVDHFKKVNDTYGHDTGDQVLSMVAGYLSCVSLGAQAYRVGGEEFSLLFPEKTVEEVLPELEKLRASIAESSFRPRVTAERRKNMRGPDRRRTGVKSPPKAKRTNGTVSLTGQLSVTISIGVAEPDARIQGIEATIAAADKALYRAKRGGRNRVEIATCSRRGLARRAASS